MKIFTGIHPLINAQEARDRVNGNIILLNSNGAWCGYQDERALVDTSTMVVITGSDARGAGTGGSTRNRKVEGVIYNLESGSVPRNIFGTTGCDDPNTPAFLLRTRDDSSEHTGRYYTAEASKSGK